METIDCRSQDGMIIGMIDSIGVLCRLLHEKVMGCELSQPITESLQDLSSNEGYRLLKLMVKEADEELIHD